MPNVLILRGFGGILLAKGMDNLANKIRKLNNIDNCYIDEYFNWLYWSETVKNSKEQFVLIGHSFGANAILKLIRLLHYKNFEKCFLFDCSPYTSFLINQIGSGTVPENIKEVFNFYQHDDLLVQGATLTRNNGSVENIHNMKYAANHIGIEIGRAHV